MAEDERAIVVRYSALKDPERYRAPLDAIFFEASHTKSFDSDAVRDVFRNRWLGRYLDERGDLAHLLFLQGHVSPDTLAGYVIGAHEDPATTNRYDDIGYFHLLADVTRRFPAHLHINLRHDVRSQGLGSLLVEQFVDDVAAAGLAGVHVVTGAGLRNVSFYQRNGFSFAHAFAWKAKDLVFLGRPVGTRSMLGA